MDNSEYKFNPESLSYDKVNLTFRQKLMRKVVPQVLAGIVIAFLLFIGSSYIITTPEERELRRENKLLEEQYEALEEKLKLSSEVLQSIQKRDNSIYQAIFEADPPPAANDSDRYTYLKDLSARKNSQLINDNSLRINILTGRMRLYNRNFKELIQTLKNDSIRLKISNIPSVQPIHNPDLKIFPYGYGTKIDPIYKTPTFHSGMDFAAPNGTVVFATADGVVERADGKSRILGNHIRLKHGAGYHTVYAHLSKILVSPGQKVKKGQAIGHVGDTGKSVCSHLHYEVHKNGKPVNPINFYFAELTPQQYEKMVQMASMSGQTLD